MKPDKYTEFWHRTLRFRKKLAKVVSGVLFFSGLITLFALIYDAGFQQSEREEQYLFTYYIFTKRLLLVGFAIRTVLNFFNPDKRVFVKLIDFVFLILLFFILSLFRKGEQLPDWLSFLPSYKYLIAPYLLLVFFVEFSRNAVSFYTRNSNPALIFLLSFFLIIAAGTGLLMLPNASVERISLIDALFTSTSAVCVTGLIVVDTATHFTELGKWILLLLIQIGGLGIMTFAGFIGHMFSGGASFQQTLFLGQFSNAEKLGEAMKTIYKIIIITFTVESLGALAIFQSLPEGYFNSFYDELFFSVFHSISAFCNAGFSTLSLGMYDVHFRFNYPILLILAFLLIFGGIGFPIMLNIYNYVKLQLRNVFDYVFRSKRFRHVPYILNFNSKLIFISTLFLILAGWAGFYILEYNGVLREHSFTGKLVTAFFGGTTPRTAGFNSVNMPDLMFSTVFLNILLMYIGASPGGTGGGIKTTTFSVMIINFWNIASGKDKIIAFGHEIRNDSVNRAFSILSLSLIVLGLSITIIHAIQPGLDLIHVIFECFSAFSTVGLSIGITPQLTDASKVIICLLMFIGRIGVLTFLSAFLFKKSQDLVRYPKEEVIF